MCNENLTARPAYAKIVMRGGAVWQLVGLITQRSQVQILPPQPIFSIDYELPGVIPKTTLAHDSHRCRFRGLCFWLVRGATGWLQNHLDHVPVCLPFAVRHCPAVDIHCGLNAGMAHQLSLYPNRCVGLVQPRPEAVPEGLPAHCGCDPRCFRCWLDVLLFEFPPDGMVYRLRGCRYASSSPTSSGARGTKSREYSVFTSPTRP